MTVTAAKAEGQRVVGVVVDSASRQPIPGVAVLLIGARGDTLDRALTGAGGTFRLTAWRGAAHVRAIRIGFAPAEVPIGVPDDPIETLEVRLARLASLLGPVLVRANPRCPTGAERARALGLWQQAQAGFTAAILARLEMPAQARRIAFAQVRHVSRDEIVRHTVRRDTASTDSGVFVAPRSADEFRQQGFTTSTVGRYTYLGLDAEVVADPSFPLHYCLSLARGAHQRPRQVGLEFAPAQRARNLVDVRGVIWIDTIQPAIAEVAFEYLGLPRTVSAIVPGGEIAYASLRPGFVVPVRWQLRMAGAFDEAEMSLSPLLGRARYATIAGAEIARISWPDGTEWRARLATVVASLQRSDGTLASGVPVRLAETDYAGVSGEDGVLQIEEMLPGRYRPFALDPLLEPIHLAIPLGTGFEAFRDSTHHLRFTVPTVEEHVMARCREGPSGTTEGRGRLIGRLFDASGRPAGAHDFMLWTGDRIGVPAPIARIRTASDGSFQFCDDRLVRGARIRLTDGGRERTVLIDHVARADLTVLRVDLP